MQKDRATSGVELHVELTGDRVRAGLEHELREAVREGRLRPGTRLPSSRTLAKDLDVGRNTVVDAYGQLVAEGWFEARPGAGTWVADRPDAPASSPDPAAATGATGTTGAAAAGPIGPTGRAMPHEEATAVRFDLRPGVPDLGSFPRTAWLAAARRALATAPDEVLGYGDPRGLPVLREALAGYLARARRVAVAPGAVVITNGFTEGLDLVGTALRQRGATTMAVEAHGHALHREIAEAAGLRLAPLPVDERGAVVDGLGDTVRADAVLLTPAHQFPLGVALDPARRRRAVAWAADSGSIVVEDDYDGEFRYDRQAVGAMQSIAPARVVYAGTASKSLAPGLRLGWLVLPSPLIDEVVELRRSRGAFASALDQLILAELITSGVFDRHVRRTRLAYRRRRDRLVAHLARHAPGVVITGIAAGLHALAHLPEGQSEADVVERAAARGLAIQGLGAYTVPGFERTPALVVGYGTPPEHAYSAALARLSATLDLAK
jgi:GntR family transcriptional regulator / MocR family aminotransferase